MTKNEFTACGDEIHLVRVENLVYILCDLLAQFTWLLPTTSSKLFTERDVGGQN
jgi:hypothetical protein